MKPGVLIGIIIILLVCLCCVGMLILGALGYGVFYLADHVTVQGTLFPSLPFLPQEPATSTPKVIRPLPTATPSISSTTVPMESLPGVPVDTLHTLQQANIPISDLRKLTQRYKGIADIPLTLEPATDWQEIGDQTKFWVINVDTNNNFQIEATLTYITDHVYFWVQNGVFYHEKDLRHLVDQFEQQIYPTNRAFFGSEWSPGIDSDPHIYIIYASDLGGHLAGYFSSADSLHPLVHPFSNAHEMFLLNADTMALDETYTVSVLAHEFQHMIHWYQDRNESSWLTEGFSELASLLNGVYDSYFDREYASQADIQLNDWPEDTALSRPHYGASFLFVTYFLDRFGEQATQALVRHPDNSLDSVDAVLGNLQIIDPLRHKLVSADDFFIDWAITNYLQDDQLGDGRYDYHIYSEAPRFEATERFPNCPTQLQTRTVNQYGVDYLRITCRGSHTLSWSGSIQTGVLSSNPHSGSYYLWSNQGDESEMTLTRKFDLSQVSGAITLDYWTWYDLEKDFDFLYLSVSEDGQTWQILTTPSGTSQNLSGNSFGWGYNGLSGGGETARWIKESVDLSPFSGKVIQVRFDYVTDGAVYKEGFLLDDVSVPEIGYFSDFEKDAGGWEMDGWVRIQNVLPQTFQLALIKLGDETSIEYLTLEPDLSIELPVEIGEEFKEMILVIAGTTRFTRLPAAYQFEIK